MNKDAGCTIIPQWLFDTAYAASTVMNDTSAIFRFKKAGRAWLKAVLNSGCTTYIDSIQVEIFNTPLNLNLGNETSLCPGNQIVLKAGSGYQSYTWQDGSVDFILLANKAGTYSVEVHDGCGNVLRDTIIVSPKPPIPFTPLADRIKCNNDTLHLDAAPGFINYVWSPNYQISSTSSRSVVINPSVDTAYYLAAEKTQGCFIYDTIKITIHQSSVIRLGNDTSFCQGRSLTLDAGSGFTSYLWSNGSSTQQLMVSQKGA